MDSRLPSLALVLAVAACASTMEWSKPGVTQAEIDADLNACRAAAEKIPVVPRQQTTTPSGAPSYPTGSGLDADRQLVLAQRLERCMRERGYQLVQR